MPLPEPGEIYYLPTEQGSHDKDRPRPHVVLSPANQNDVIVTLAFISTGELQARHFRAPHVYVDDATPLFSLTGLDRSSYVYPSRLVTCYRDDLPRPAGKLIDEMAELLDVQLPRAVGIGAPVSRNGGTGAPARRGHIARFTTSYADLVGTPYGVVISNPAYSKRR